MVGIQLGFKSIFPGVLLVLLGACTPTKEPASAAEELYAIFKELAPPDTLHIDLDSLSSGIAHEVSFGLLFAAIDSALLQSFIYEPDSIGTGLQALWKLSLDEEHDLCILEMRQHWFQFRYGLVYAKASRQFIHLEPLAYFYGGEGGQLFSESWLLNRQILISREIERTLRWTAEEAGEESIRSSLSATKWATSEFRQLPVPDSLYWAQQEPFLW